MSNLDGSVSDENQDDVHSINLRRAGLRKSSDAALNDFGSKYNHTNPSLNQICGTNIATPFKSKHVDEHVMKKLNKHVMVFKFYNRSTPDRLHHAPNSDYEQSDYRFSEANRKSTNANDLVKYSLLNSQRNGRKNTGQLAIGLIKISEGFFEELPFFK